VAIADRLYPFTITGVAVLESCTENAVGKPGGVAYTGEVPLISFRLLKKSARTRARARYGFSYPASASVLTGDAKPRV
jgi:hypothetical protein